MAAAKSAKKDFDKEYIYNLIMPSDPVAPPEAAEPNLPEPVEESAPVARDGLALLRDQLSSTAPASVQLPPAQAAQLVNLTERLVIDRLDEVFAKFNCCRCDRCKRDVAALALNLLPPHYVVADPDSLPGRLAEQPTKEIAAALVKAILQVKSHPRH